MSGSRPTGRTTAPPHELGEGGKGLTKASCPFDYAGPLTETMLLGIVALRTGQGRRIQYDGDAGRVTNATEANQFLQREYRAGWVL